MVNTRTSPIDPLVTVVQALNSTKNPKASTLPKSNAKDSSNETEIFEDSSSNPYSAAASQSSDPTIPQSVSSQSPSAPAINLIPPSCPSLTMASVSNEAVIATISNLVSSLQRDEAATNNIKYFSLSHAISSHKEKPVEHDSDKWVRSINREYSDKSDKVKCSLALQHALGTAKSILDELIEIHDSQWETVSKEFISFCRKPENSTSLQLELLSLNRKVGESIQDLYVRASGLGARLMKDKPHLKDLIQEQMSDSFAKAISDKFFHTLVKEDKVSLRTVFSKALSYAETRPDIMAGPSRSTTAKIAAVADNTASDNPPPNNPRRYFDHPNGSRNGTSQRNCGRCNGPHNTFYCYRKRLACHHCGKLGHVVIECNLKKKGNQSNRGNSRSSESRANLGFNGGRYHLNQPRVNSIDSDTPSFTLESLSAALDCLTNEEFVELLDKKKLRWKFCTSYKPYS